MEERKLSKVSTDTSDLEVYLEVARTNTSLSCSTRPGDFVRSSFRLLIWHSLSTAGMGYKARTRYSGRYEHAAPASEDDSFRFRHADHNLQIRLFSRRSKCLSSLFSPHITSS